MNKVTILLILSCAAVYVRAEDISRQREEEILTQCYAEVGLDYAKVSEDAKIMSEDEIVEKMTPYKIGCISSCFLKIVLDNKISVRQHILDSLDKAEAQYPEAEMAEFTDKARQCIYEVKEDDCVLVHCLRPWDYRVAAIIGL